MIVIGAVATVVATAVVVCEDNDWIHWIPNVDLMDGLSDDAEMDLLQH